MRKLLIIFALLLFCPSVFAATYYVDSAAANDSGNGSISTPKKYIPSGIALLSASGGDTLIIKNGTYSGSSNNITSLPNSASNYNTIQAETDGSVIISASFAVTSGSHVVIEGLKLTAAESKGCDATYVKFKRCAFQNGQVCSSGCDGAVNWATGSYQLYEDCWFYGVGGRYTVLNYESTNVVYRRVIIRHETGSYTFDGSNPEAPLANYGAANMSYQNVILIDNDQTYSTAYTSSYYITGHTSNPASNNVSFIGCMDINGKSASFYSDTDDGSKGMTFTDFIAFGNDTGIADGNTGIAINVNRMTMGKMSNDAISRWAGSITVSNSIIFNHTAAGSGSKTVTYTNTYNPSSYSGTGVTHDNPITNGLLYLPRIEAGSTLKTAGSGGGQMGAQVIYKVGIDGTLYGESGYNTVTENELWPWPNEDRIKTDMEAVSDRGFTAYSGMDGVHNTLTTYIWEYLGNEIPADIYGEEEPAATIPISGVTFSGVRFNM
jgi:hypothetical protein